MLEDAYRGERATPAVQCEIGQEPRCFFDYGDEAFPYPLEHVLDRFVGQQTVPPYRYIHPLCPFLSVLPCCHSVKLRAIPRKTAVHQRHRRGMLRKSNPGCCIASFPTLRKRCARYPSASTGLVQLDTRSDGYAGS